MVLGLGVSAEKANTPLQVFIGDREAHDTAIKIAHFHQVIAKSPTWPNRVICGIVCSLVRRSVHVEERFLTLPRGLNVSTLEPG